MIRKISKRLFYSFFMQIVMSSSTSFAQVVYVNPDTSIQIPVDSKYGSTIALPANVHIATSPLYFKAQPLRAESTADSKDVSVFQIMPPESKRHITDKMNVLLWNGKSISIQFVVDNDIADTMYTLKFNSPSDEKSHRKSESESNGNHLLSQKNLLIHMIKDDPTDDRRVVRMDVNFPGYPDVSMRLVRLFHDDDLSGYVFLVTNTSKKTLTLNATALSMGKPNRISLIQIDYEKLESCKENNSNDPRGTGCTTALRIVAHEDSSSSKFAFSNAQSSSDSSKVPFVTIVKDPKKDKGTHS